MKTITKEFLYHCVILSKSHFVIIGDILHALVRVLRRNCFVRILDNRAKSSHHVDTVEPTLFAVEGPKDGPCFAAVVRGHRYVENSIFVF